MQAKLTLNAKLIWVFCLFLLIGIINSGVIYWVVSHQKANSRAINLAGRQQMLSQKLAKEVFIAQNRVNETELKARAAGIDATVTSFDNTLQGLLPGDDKLKLRAVPQGGTRQKLVEVEGLWREFSRNIKLFSANNIADQASSQAAA